MDYLNLIFRSKVVILSLLLLVVLQSNASENNRTTKSLKVFQADSLEQIKKGHTGKPFILIVWSVDCLPCRQEFEMLRIVKNQYPELNLSIVATESIEEFPQLSDILAEHQLLQEDNWAFAETHSAKLRYQLDPRWYGELPRAYFYDKQHARFSISGKLVKSNVIEWLTEVNKES
jgi:thiol-disulfide isomerase/thioredoxin